MEQMKVRFWLNPTVCFLVVLIKNQNSLVVAPVCNLCAIKRVDVVGSLLQLTSMMKVGMVAHDFMALEQKIIKNTCFLRADCDLKFSRAMVCFR